MKLKKRTIIICAAAALLAIAASVLLTFPREYGDTDEFRAFLKRRSLSPSISREEKSGNYTYVLKNGSLRFLNENAEEIWRSNKYWYIDDFRVFDVDGDGNDDCLFSVWKSYSFCRSFSGNDDPGVKNHLFLYTIRCGRAKDLWSSSNLPRRILSFEPSEGKRTPAYSGTVLRTVEESYGDASGESRREYVYIWRGWGFRSV